MHMADTSAYGRFSSEMQGGHSNDTQFMEPGNQAHHGADLQSAARLITGLAVLPAKTLLDERAIASLFNVTTRTVRRMIARFELPPPVMLAGRSTWIAERVIAHIEERAERAARRAALEAQRIEALTLR